MPTPEEASAALAILIDADNANPAIVKGLIDEVAKFGRATVRRIYGDWTTPNLGKWKESLLEHSIQPIQQFAYTKGKNATDSTMIIDAMDLLYTTRFDGFCIVSSDSDFTRLAARIRESGLTVYGFGEQKTPAPFVRACDKFIYTEILVPRDEGIQAAASQPVRAPGKDKQLAGLLRAAVEGSSDESGWASLSAVGNLIAKQEPDFDPRNYGFRKLSDLVESSQLFDIEERGTSRMLYVRERRAMAAKPAPSRRGSTPAGGSKGA